MIDAPDDLFDQPEIFDQIEQETVELHKKIKDLKKKEQKEAIVAGRPAKHNNNNNDNDSDNSNSDSDDDNQNNRRKKVRISKEKEKNISNNKRKKGTISIRAAELQMAEEYDKKHNNNKKVQIDSDDDDNKSKKSKSKRKRSSSKRKRDNDNNSEDEENEDENASSKEKIYKTEDWDDSDQFWKRKVNGYKEITYQDLLDYVPRDEKDPNYFKIKVEAILPYRGRNGKTHYYEENSIKHLASELLPLLPEKPSIEILSENIQSLCKVTRLTTKPIGGGEADDDYEKPFYILDNYIYIRRDLVKWNSKSKFELAVKKVFQHKHTIPSEKIFGIEPSKEHYHIFKKITLEKTDVDLIIENPEYISEQTKETLNINLENIMRGQGYLTKTEYKDKDEDISLPSHLRVDYSLSASVFFRHIKSIGWGKSFLEKFGIWPESVTHTALLEARKIKIESWKQLLKEAESAGDDEKVELLKSKEPKELKPYPLNLGLQSIKEMEDVAEKEMNDKNRAFDGKYSLQKKIEAPARCLRIDKNYMDKIQKGELTEGQMDSLRKTVTFRLPNEINSNNNNNVESLSLHNQQDQQDEAEDINMNDEEQYGIEEEEEEETDRKVSKGKRRRASNDDDDDDDMHIYNSENDDNNNHNDHDDEDSDDNNNKKNKKRKKKLNKLKKMHRHTSNNSQQNSTNKRYASAPRPDEDDNMLLDT